MPANSVSMTLAACWLALILLIAAFYVWQLFRKSEYSLWENCLYVPTFLMGRMLWRVTFRNEAPPELQFGALLVANHRSSVDPFFVQLAARRRVHWMVAKEYCNHFLFGPILRAAQVIPTNRSGMDTASTKAAIRITRAGRLVGMFPEGKINRTSTLLMPIRSGAAVVASRAGVPIIPLLIEGSPFRDTVWSPVFMPARVQITFGTPISTTVNDTLPHGKPAKEATDESPSIGQSEHEKAPNSQLADSDQLIVSWGKELGILAGQQDFPVQLASARTRRQNKQMH